MDMMVDGVPITVEVDGNHLLIPRKDGLERVCISEFDVEVIDGQLVMVHEANPKDIIIGIIVALIVAGLAAGYDALTTFTAQQVDVNQWILRGNNRRISFNLNVPHPGFRPATHISLTISAHDVDLGERHRVYVENRNGPRQRMFIGLLGDRCGSGRSGNQRTLYSRFVVPRQDLDRVHTFMNQHHGEVDVIIQACSRISTDGNVFIRAARFVIDW